MARLWGSSKGPSELRDAFLITLDFVEFFSFLSWATSFPF